MAAFTHLLVQSHPTKVFTVQRKASPNTHADSSNQKATTHLPGVSQVSHHQDMRESKACKCGHHPH
jgi:hypothetical protein